jgi:hypothetical protein
MHERCRLAFSSILNWGGELARCHRALLVKWFSSPTSVCRGNLPETAFMRTRERILANLESIYRESYDRAKQAADQGRMIDLDSAYMRDQLMLEILLDIRDLFSVAPAASGGSALERLEALRRLTKLP